MMLKDSMHYFMTTWELKNVCLETTSFWIPAGVTMIYISMREHEYSAGPFSQT